MNNLNALRQALAGKEAAAANGRAAGEGIWTYYARAMLWHDNKPDTVDAFDNKHTALISKLEAIKGLSKNERNSLTSAKCVLRKAYESGVQVWRTDDAGALALSDDGEGNNVPSPRGKSDLQDAKSDFERIMQSIESAKAKFGKDSREPLTKAQYDELSRVILAFAFDIGNEAKALEE